MKRPLALALTIAIFAAIAVCFLRPASSDFGYLREIYVSPPTAEFEIAGATGDTALLRPVAMSRAGGVGDLTMIYFEAADGFEAALTSRRYKDGEHCPNTPEPEYRLGFAEKLVDGEWEFYCEIYDNSSLPLIPGYTPFFSYAGEFWHLFTLPWYDPGEYRVTYYFRQCITRERSHYTTGDELYSVTHSFTAPEPSGSRFDVIGISFYTGDIWVTLRANDGEAPYIDGSRCEIERNEKGVWTSDGISAEIANYDPSKQFYRSHYDYDWMMPDDFERYGVYVVKFDGVTREYDYRLTLHFNENEDGSGEQYDLTLNLRFGEVPDANR